MKILRCKDFGTICDFISVGNETDDVMNRMVEHFEKEHRDVLDQMSEDDKKDMESRMEVPLSRGCGCGAL